MKKRFLSAVFFWSALVAGIESHAGETVDRIVAVVDKDIITLSEVKAYTAQRTSVEKDPLEALIREKLMQLEMDRLKIEVNDTDISRAIHEVLASNRIPLETLKAELSKKGIPYDQYKKDLGEQIRRMKFLSQVIYPRIRISEDEILKKAGSDSSEEGRLKARMALYEAQASLELDKYLDEARSKTYVEIKK